ncbi:MAG: ComEA family DNA-binding protein, partial [Enterocloster sp.]|nr:ComEA family DNA-binding protein [Enterocloster sp.]
FVTDPGDDFSGSPGKSASTGRKVNLNKAGAEELMTLTGIGKSRAEAIIQYRQEVGAFRSIEDIMNVSGIKESAFEKIRDDITV